MLRWLWRRVLRRSRWAIVRRSWAGTRHQPADSASASRFERRHPQERGQVRARPEAVHVRLAATGLAADEHPHERRVVVDVDLAPLRRRPVAEDLAGPIGQDDGQTADAHPGSRGPSHPPGRLGKDRVQVAGAPPRRDSCGHRAVAPCRWKAGAASPQAQGMPVDETDRLLGDERVTDEHPRDGPVGQRPAGEIEARVQEETRRPGPR